MGARCQIIYIIESIFWEPAMSAFHKLKVPSYVSPLLLFSNFCSLQKNKIFINLFKLILSFINYTLVENWIGYNNQKIRRINMLSQTKDLLYQTSSMLFKTPLERDFFDLTVEKGNIFDIIEETLYQISDEGIANVNSFVIPKAQKRLIEIKNRLLEIQQENEKCNPEQSIARISEYLNKLESISQWFETEETWRKAFVEKKQWLLSLDSKELNSTISNITCPEKIIDARNLSDRLLNDCVTIDTPKLLQKASFSALTSLASRHRNNSTLISTIVERIRQEPSTGTANNKFSKLEDLSEQIKKESGINSPKRIYIVKEIEAYMEKRLQNRREYKTTFLNRGFGYSRTIKLQAAQAFLNLVQKENITLEDWEGLKPRYKAALQQGSLGNVFKEFNKLLKHEITSKDDYMNYHIGYTGFR